MPPPGSDPDRDSLADLGSLLGPIVHETSNFLNALLLNVAILESSVLPEGRAELDDIRHQGAKLGAIMRLAQQRRRPAGICDPVDLNESARGVVANCACAAEPLIVPGPASELERLIRFLVKASGSESACTRRDGAAAVLEVQCTAEAARQAENQTIDPECENALEIAVCQMIARRRGGAIRATGGGLAVTLPLPSTNDGRG